jgi:hypothetical protein
MALWPHESKPDVTTTADCDRANDWAIKGHADMQPRRLSKIAANTILPRNVDTCDGASMDDLHRDSLSAIGTDSLDQRAHKKLHSAGLEPPLKPC